MPNDAASELNDRDQRSLLCGPCAEGHHKDCEQDECACDDCRDAAAERAQQRDIERFYGGDGIRSYGPSDPKGW